VLSNRQFLRSRLKLSTRRKLSDAPRLHRKPACRAGRHRVVCGAYPYLSSRTFGGWSGPGSGSPDPYAYESGFATRWVVQSQIKSDAQLNFDPDHGAVMAPLVLWGPYLWARGNSPRKLDGLVWTESSVRADRLHPNEAGTRKTTAHRLNFFKTNEGTSRWFLKPGEKAQVTPLPK